MEQHETHVNRRQLQEQVNAYLPPENINNIGTNISDDRNRLREIVMGGPKGVVPRKTRPQAINWMVTINNFEPADKLLFQNESLFKYSCFGEEIGEQGTPHLQGYISTHKPIRLSALKKYFPTAHLDICRGRPDQCRAYCLKDGIFTEFGDCPLTGGQTTKKNYEDALKYAKEGNIDSIDPELQVKYWYD